MNIIKRKGLLFIILMPIFVTIAFLSFIRSNRRPATLLSQVYIDGYHCAVLSQTNGIQTRILLYKSPTEYYDGYGKDDIIDTETIKNKFRLSSIIVTEELKLNYSRQWKLRALSKVPIYYHNSKPSSSYN